MDSSIQSLTGAANPGLSTKCMLGQPCFCMLNQPPTRQYPNHSCVLQPGPSLPPVINYRLLLIGALTSFALLSCRKDEVFTDDAGAKLVLTEDTVLFDTIFTTVGSATKRFTVRNENDNAVRVDIALEGGTPSPFRINVDGASGVAFDDVEILGGDSLFIFVEATLDQNNASNPFIFEDHILLNTNGNEQSVLLLAWGQDAVFYRPDQSIQGLPAFSYIAGGLDADSNQICETVTWTVEKPIVIFGYAVVDECCKLIIDPGVKVYFHGGGGLWVYRGGAIEANGELENRITFQGDRLEATYDDLPNQWDRIWINESDQDNRLSYCEIKNALIGIQAQTWPLTDGQPLSSNTLWLDNVSIKNCLTAGLYTENYRIKATNLLVGDAGQYSVVLTGSGSYQFDHPTIANYWSFDIRQDPAFLMTNSFIDLTGTEQLRAIETSTFTNGIIYGNNTNEFKLEIDEAAGVNYTFERFLFKTDQALDDGHFLGGIFQNQNPGFVDAAEGDLHLSSELVFAADKGGFSPVGVTNDLDGQFYGDDGTIPVGCYEPNN